MCITRVGKNTIGQKIFTAIAKWSLGHLKKYGKLPVGLPGHRDPDNQCAAYQPNEIMDKWSLYHHCETDGHYLCSKCIHRLVIEEGEDEQ